MALIILRCSFFVAAAGVASLFLNVLRDDNPYLVFGGILVLALILLAGDLLLPRKRIDTISAVYFGLLIGLILTWALSIAIFPFFEVTAAGELRSAILTAIGVGLCYVCISMLLQTKDDFRFIIPYVEFAKEVKGLKPLILDTSVVIDGRIADLLETEILDGQLIMPRFVLGELQSIADSSDKLRRSRGRRGLDILNRLRNNDRVDLQVFDRDLPELSGHPVDMKLILLAKHLEGKIVTGDYNLNKVAKVNNVPVINLNDVANSLKPVYLPGEGFEVSIVKPGESLGQGVGYLDDGTMIVVEGGREHIGETVSIVVTSVLQTSAGRMIFGRYEG